MKRESLDLFDKIFIKMMEKVSKKLIENGVSVEKYRRGIIAAARHPQLMADLLGFTSYEMNADWNVIGNDEICIETSYLFTEWDRLVAPKHFYTNFVMDSFDLVAADDELAELLGTQAYVDIIEEANMLVLKGLAKLEGIDISAADGLLYAIGKYF